MQVFKNSSRVFNFLRYPINKFLPYFYNLRYFGVFNVRNKLNPNNHIYENSFSQNFNQSNFIVGNETKMHELFELSEKSDLFSASMLQVDISEISSVDTYKENYPFTVIIY